MTPDALAAAVDEALLSDVEPERDPRFSLRYRCPFCGAQPGRPCVKDDGRVLLLPHYSRTPESPHD